MKLDTELKSHPPAEPSSLLASFAQVAAPGRIRHTLPAPTPQGEAPTVPLPQPGGTH